MRIFALLIAACVSGNKRDVEIVVKIFLRVVGTGPKGVILTVQVYPQAQGPHSSRKR